MRLAGPVNDSFASSFGPSQSADRLELFFHADGVHASRRESIDASWGSASRLFGGSYASISADGTTLLFAQSGDIFYSTRQTTADSWGRPQNIGSPINSSLDDIEPYLSADGRTLCFARGDRSQLHTFDVYMSTRESVSAPWQEPVALGPEINTSLFESSPSVSTDHLILYFSSFGGSGEILVSSRASVNDPWGPAINLGMPVNFSMDEIHSTISWDGSTLYFARGGFFSGVPFEIYSATKIPEPNALVLFCICLPFVASFIHSRAVQACSVIPSGM